MVKTNAMRMLDKAKIEYRTKEYEVDENDLSGSHAADMMRSDHGSVFKTLVLKGGKDGLSGLLHLRGCGAGFKEDGQGGRR